MPLTRLQRDKRKKQILNKINVYKTKYYKEHWTHVCMQYILVSVGVIHYTIMSLLYMITVKVFINTQIYSHAQMLI